MATFDAPVDTSRMSYTTTDHDLLIELRTEMSGLRGDVKSLNDDTKLKINDHETRLRFLERYAWLAIGALGFLQILLNYIKQ